MLLLIVCDRGSSSEPGGVKHGAVPTNGDKPTTANSPQKSRRFIRGRHLYGIDISHNQHYHLSTLEPFIDSLSFVIVKASGGEDYVDPQFKPQYWQHIKHMGFTRGAYHTFYVWDKPEVQAHHFVQTVGSWAADDFPPIVDFEKKSFKNFQTTDPELHGKEDFSMSTDSVQARLLRFLKNVEAQTGRLPMIYAGRDDAQTYLNKTAFATYPLWIADPATAHPSLPDTWNNWLLWQKGKINIAGGQKPDTDFDEFNGDDAALERFLDYTIVDSDKVPPSHSHSPPTKGPRNRTSTRSPNGGRAQIGTLYGVDISDNQSYPLSDLEQFTDSLSFVIVKATGGITYVDKRFRNGEWQGVKKLGFTRGAYHFYYVWDDPIAQAHHFMSTVGTWLPDDLPPIVDFEGHSFFNFREGKKNTSIPIERIQRQLLQFLAEVKLHSGRLPMIYTNPSNANKYLSIPAFAEYPLWVADPNNGLSEPTLPLSWRKKGWAIWQRGYIYIPDKGGTETDFDEFNGDEAALKRFLRSTVLSN